MHEYGGFVVRILFHIQSEYGKIRTKFSVFKNFSHSEKISLIKTIFGMAFLTFFEASMLFFYNPVRRNAISFFGD